MCPDLALRIELPIFFVTITDDWGQINLPLFQGRFAGATCCAVGMSRGARTAQLSLDCIEFYHYNAKLTAWEPFIEKCVAQRRICPNVVVVECLHSLIPR